MITVRREHFWGRAKNMGNGVQQKRGSSTLSGAMVDHAKEILVAAEEDGIAYALSDDEAFGFCPGRVTDYLRDAWKLEGERPKSAAEWGALAAVAAHAITAEQVAQREPSAKAKLF
jgi:hypothetical protein